MVFPLTKPNKPIDTSKAGVTIISVQPGSVRIGIEAPEGVSVQRDETAALPALQAETASPPADGARSTVSTDSMFSEFYDDNIITCDNLNATIERQGCLAESAEPQTYGAQIQELERQMQELRQHIAARLLPALKDEMQRRPHATHDDKKELAQWANAELKRFGLAFKSPKTGKASYLVTDKGYRPEEGRFLLRSEGEGGKTEAFVTAKLSGLLDALELIDAPVRQEGLANWAARAKDSGRTIRR